MDVRPRLAVLAVLAAGGTAAGRFFLWPSGRNLPACHAPVPAAAQKALTIYEGRIRHDVERSHPGRRVETWSDPLTGRTRQLTYERGQLTFAFATVPAGGFAHYVWVLYASRTWMSDSLRLPGNVTVRNAAAQGAQANRDNVAASRARVVGKEMVDGRETVHLLETVLHPGPTFQVDTWVDPLTYVTVRTRLTARGRSSVTEESWLSRTAGNVAATRIAVPSGFTHEVDRGSVLTYTDRALASGRCA